MKNALKEHYKSLTKDEQRSWRKQKAWETLGFITAFILFVAFFSGGGYLLSLIEKPSVILWRILWDIGMVIGGLLTVILSGVLTFILTFPFIKKMEQFKIPPLKKEIIPKACEHLRVYYNLQEPYVVTKCYDCTDKKFINHDVCIFVANNELRITVDLIKGFLYGEKDLGCYAFKQGEITLSKIQDGNHLIAQLKADNTVFVLGYRAKSFIKKHFPLK